MFTYPLWVFQFTLCWRWVVILTLLLGRHFHNILLFVGLFKWFCFLLEYSFIKNFLTTQKEKKYSDIPKTFLVPEKFGTTPSESIQTQDLSGKQLKMETVFHISLASAICDMKVWCKNAKAGKFIMTRYLKFSQISKMRHCVEPKFTSASTVNWMPWQPLRWDL